MIGSASMWVDNRSMRLNFELGVLAEDREFDAEEEAAGVTGVGRRHGALPP